MDKISLFNNWKQVKVMKTLLNGISLRTTKTTNKEVIYYNFILFPYFLISYEYKKKAHAGFLFFLNLPKNALSRSLSRFCLKFMRFIL
jgi:hypothetical protein